MNAFTTLLTHFALNFAVAFVIVRFIYYPQQRHRNYVFTFFTFNTVIFFVMGLLSDAQIGMGAGFGLFAIFSILRYRTDTIPIREMTYLFVLIALPVANSILLLERIYAEFIVVNATTALLLYVLEKGWGFQYETRKQIVYERIEMIRAENWDALLTDLQTRTGLPIKRIEVGRIDFVRDIAEIAFYYDEKALAPSHVKFSTEHGLDNYQE